ncbi:MAG TPA: OmpA family protein [Chitinophagaceae bacterium]|nr:OmpA family protein [Chitinophagaceae bacterium]
MKQTFFTSLFLVCLLSVQAQLAYNSKYDFVPGEKIMAMENFAAAELGDFPLGWKTDASAEVVTVNGKPGKWLKVSKKGVFYPEFINDLPANFTLEFDVAVNTDWNEWPVVLNITNLKTPKEYTNYYHYVDWKGTHTIHMQFAPAIVDVRQGNSKLVVGRSGNHDVNNDVAYKTWNNADLNFAHISLWRQDKRLRVYLNGEKIWDVQEVFDPASKYNAITFAHAGNNNPDNYFLLSNIRLAVGAPDVRQKLAGQKKFVTSGILFDAGSDEIRPESYGVLREIGNYYRGKADSLTGFQIIGHTDSDGDPAKNLELSKHRAAAVKNYLVKEYGLPADIIVTDGKGASNPIDKNTTVVGKANNRRVEFLSLPITVKPAGGSKLPKP